MCGINTVFLATVGRFPLFNVRYVLCLSVMDLIDLKRMQSGASSLLHSQTSLSSLDRSGADGMTDGQAARHSSLPSVSGSTMQEPSRCKEESELLRLGLLYGHTKYVTDWWMLAE